MQDDEEEIGLGISTGSVSAKRELAEIAEGVLIKAGGPRTLRTLVFPPGATIPAEVAGQALVDAMYRVSVGINDKTPGTVSFTPVQTRYVTAKVGRFEIELKPGLLLTRTRLGWADGKMHPKVMDLVVRARNEFAAASAARPPKK